MLLTFRETPSWSSIQHPPFFRARLRLGNDEPPQKIIFLLPVDFSYDQLITLIQSAVSRRCLQPEQIPFDCPVRLAVPLAGTIEVEISVLNNDDLQEAMDLFQDAFDTMSLSELLGDDEPYTPPLSESDERRSLASVRA